MDKNEMDTIYKTLPLAKIPWNKETPPDALVEIIESGNVKPCRVIDLGCGAGNYAIYLAKKGFTVTGVDISPTAIEIAKKNTEKQGVKCNFMVLDVLLDLEKIDDTFEFAYDWQILHHIFPKYRGNYVKNVHRITYPRRKISLCLLARKIAILMVPENI